MPVIGPLGEWLYGGRRKFRQLIDAQGYEKDSRHPMEIMNKR